jgi:signal transduction histidine kinase
MKRWSRGRDSAVKVVLFLLVGVIGWAAWHTFGIIQEVDRAPLDLNRIARENLEIADNVDSFVEVSHAALAKVTTEGDQNAWARFQHLSSGFKDWLTERRQSVTTGKIIMVRPISLTVDVGGLLVSLEDATGDYIREAAPVAKAGLSITEREIIEERAETKALRLSQLGLRARAQADGIRLFLEGSANWLSWLRRLMQAALLTLSVAGLWLGLLVYRRVVTPLRERLVESQAIIERQQKLVHFGELAAMVAHEIRNPLTAISTRLFTLQRSLARGSREDADATLIRDEIHRLNRIVKDFLESAQPSAPVLAPMTAGQLFEQIQRLLEPTCASQHIELKVEESTDAPFLADSQQLTQVFINLIQNAADAIGQDGTIRLRARQEQRRLYNRPTAVVLLEVEDTGPGIPSDVQPRLFDPFFSTKPSGTGLGLSIAARIVGRHCGLIDFRSQPGRTVFTVVLPAHEAKS